MKFKQIPNEYYLTILDRLTRFEPAFKKFNRVFNDIISKFYFGDNKKDLSLIEKIEIAQFIINQGLEPSENDEKLISTLKALEEKYFNFNEVSYQYISTRLNYFSALKIIKNFDNIPKNLKWFYEIANSKTSLEDLRNQKELLFPIEKVILCEGQTEFLLLNTLFKILGINLDKLGFYIIQAGGKNQVARKYYQMLEYTKLPFFILLDKDGLTVSKQIEAKIRPKDRLYLIQSGEFEDLIPVNILLKAINSEHNSSYICNFDDFNPESTMVENLENIFRKYGYGDFKKAHFASVLNDYLNQNISKEDLINSEINQILKELLK